jgi:hypothetical protein
MRLCLVDIDNALLRSHVLKCRSVNIERGRGIEREIKRNKKGREGESRERKVEIERGRVRYDDLIN